MSGLRRVLLAVCILLIFGSRISSGAAEVSKELIHRAVDFCRSYEPAQPPRAGFSIHMSDDKTILCYDGGLFAQDASVIDELRSGGTFVIRSPGGLPASAMKIADILESKMATVVVRDYCMSACAGFVYIATATTYVVRNSVVAWHAPSGYQPLCEHHRFDRWVELVQLWTSLPAEVREEYCNSWSVQSAFFKKRGTDDNFLFATKSTHVSKEIIKLADNYHVNTGELFWMWHPRYHDHFTTKVIYESYPRDQYEVDEIARKFGLSKIIYDP